MHWGSGWGARFDAKGHGVADCSHPVKGFASGFATLDCLLPICCAAAKASMDKPCLPAIHFLLLTPALTPLTFWVTFCVTFHLTNTSEGLFISNPSFDHSNFYIGFFLRAASFAPKCQTYITHGRNALTKYRGNHHGDRNSQGKPLHGAAQARCGGTFRQR